MSTKRSRVTSTSVIVLCTLQITGYLLLAVCFLQVLALFSVTILQYTIFNHTTIEKLSASDAVGAALAPYTGAVEAAKPTEPNLVLIAGLWVALVVIAGILAYYTSRATANIVRMLLVRYFEKVTAKKLFVAKMVIPTVSFGIIALSSLLLPAITYIVPLNAILLVLCLLCFSVQHILVGHYKIPVRKVF